PMRSAQQRAEISLIGVVGNCSPRPRNWLTSETRIEITHASDVLWAAGSSQFHQHDQKDERQGCGVNRNFPVAPVWARLGWCSATGGNWRVSLLTNRVKMEDLGHSLLLAHAPDCAHKVSHRHAATSDVRSL